MLVPVYGWAAESPEWRAPDRTCRVILTVPGIVTNQAESAVFFVDFTEVGHNLDWMDRIRKLPFIKSITRFIKHTPSMPDATTFRLYAWNGGNLIPFSLDYRLDDNPAPPGDDRPAPNGCTGGEKNPLAEGKLRQLGYVSFQPTPGETEYHLYFNMGDSKTLKVKPDKNIRPWWVEAITDPCFEADKNKDGKPDFYSFQAKESSEKFWQIVSRPGQPTERCLEISHPKGGTVHSLPGLYQFDRRAAGARVILYQQVQVDKDALVYLLTLGGIPNFFPPPPHAAIYFSSSYNNVGLVPAGDWYELCIEGRVSESFDVSVPTRYSSFTYSGPCRIGETHVQFPPERPNDQTMMGIDTDTAYRTDEIGLWYRSPEREILINVPVVLEERTGKRREIRGERVEACQEGFIMTAKLVSEKDGKVACSLNGNAARGEKWRGTMRFHDLAAGNYLLRFEARSKRQMPEIVAAMEKDIWVVSNPFE